MLFYENLQEIIFTRHELLDVDELMVLSGYVGPQPVKRLNELPMPSTVIYGMYGSEGIGKPLHESLKNIAMNNHSTNILYSKIPVHSKCYVWMNNKKIVSALIGSANFSINGLDTPYREVLADSTKDTFSPLSKYIEHIIDNSISCMADDIKYGKTSKKNNTDTATSGIIIPNKCELSLLERGTKTPQGSGINWGFSPNGHNAPDVAYIPISTKYINDHPNMFPEKSMFPTKLVQGAKANRENDPIELIWDDGTVMSGLLEGSQPVNGKKYPKQLSSSPRKNILGRYLRERLGVDSTTFVTKEMLENYGRTSITMSLIAEGIYSMDFSPRR